MSPYEKVTALHGRKLQPMSNDVQKPNDFKKPVEEYKEPSSFPGLLLPLIATSVGLLCLFTTFTLAGMYHQVNMWLISQMGALLPAYHFYALGTSLGAGLLMPCALLYYHHNCNGIVVDQATASLNLSALVFACVGAIGLALQGVFPMKEGDGPHTVFASIFFAAVVWHTVLIATMYVKSSRVKTLAGETLPYWSQFWMYWKCIFASLSALFSIATAVVMSYEYITNPLMLELLKQQKPGLLLMVGAFFEYAVVFCIFCYFISYFFDLQGVRIAVIPPPPTVKDKHVD